MSDGPIVSPYVVMCLPSLGAFIGRVDGIHAHPVLSVIDGPTGDRVAALLNRHGLEDVPIPQDPEQEKT